MAQLLTSATFTSVAVGHFSKATRQSSADVAAGFGEFLATSGLGES